MTIFCFVYNHYYIKNDLCLSFFLSMRLLLNLSKFAEAVLASPACDKEDLSKVWSATQYNPSDPLIQERYISLNQIGIVLNAPTLSWILSVSHSVLIFLAAEEDPATRQKQSNVFNK